MKIAHIVSTFPPRLGGMGEVCREEARRLARRGHQVEIFTMDYGEPVGAESGGLTVRRLKPFGRWGDAGFLPQLIFALRGFDVLHLHYPFYGSAHFVWLASVLFKKKLLVTYHMDAQPAGWFKRILQSIYDFVWVRLIFHRAAKILVVDKNFFAQSRLRRRTPAAKVMELKNGVDLEVFFPLPLSEGEVGVGVHWNNEQAARLKDKKIILFVGNLLPLKRLDILIMAMKKISEPRAVLLVIGGGYAEGTYRRLTKEYGLEDKVIFAGPCADKYLLNQYYNSAAVVAIPSEAESFSLVALEAMAAGALVAARDLPALRDLLADGRNGFLIASDEPETWAKKTEEILSAGDSLSKIKQAAVATARAYGWEEHVDKLEEMYVQL